MEFSRDTFKPDDARHTRLSKENCEQIPNAVVAFADETLCAYAPQNEGLCCGNDSPICHGETMRNVVTHIRLYRTAWNTAC